MSSQRKEDFRGDESIFDLGTDSSAGPPNDKTSMGNDMGDGRLLSEGIFRLGTDSSPRAQNDKPVGDQNAHLNGDCLDDMPGVEDF